MSTIHKKVITKGGDILSYTLTKDSNGNVIFKCSVDLDKDIHINDYRIFSRLFDWMMYADESVFNAKDKYHLGEDTSIIKDLGEFRYFLCGHNTGTYLEVLKNDSLIGSCKNFTRSTESKLILWMLKGGI